MLDPTDTVQTQIIAGLSHVTGAIEKWLVPLTAIGTVTMALIQAVKNATPARNWFQRLRLRIWLMDTIRQDYRSSRPRRFAHRVLALAASFQSPLSQERKEHRDSLNAIESDLIGLATSGDIDAFYDLPIESLCDQMRKILSVVLDYPRDHKGLLCCLARGVSKDDLVMLLRHDNARNEPSSGDATKDDLKALGAAKGRILIQTRCSIDAIQTSIGFRWKFWLQVFSMILSAILGIVALNLGAIGAGKGDLAGPPEFWTSVLIGLLAGFIAPVARDLVAGIEKWRS